MLEYARWKYLLVLLVLVLALILALPNLFGDDPALQIARKDGDPMTAASLPTIEQFLRDDHLGYTAAYLDGGTRSLFSSVSRRMKSFRPAIRRGACDIAP